jgi:preprotein translocase subunit SecD
MRFRGKLRQQFLGLILLVLVVVGAGWIVSPWHPSLKLGQFTRDLEFRLGLDLQGGIHLVYKAETKGIAEDQVVEAMAGVRDVIERRVNAFGVSEPLVQTNVTDKEARIIIELSGVFSTEEAIELIGATPQLDFRREVVEEEAVQQFNIDDPTAITGPIFERTALTGKNLKRASVSFDPVSGRPEVTLQFDNEGQALFAEITRQNLQRRIAIYLDEVPISAPVVQQEITNGQAVISGGFTLPEARQLAQNLNAGALPIPIELVSQQIVGPTLGRVSLEQSLKAGWIALIAVIVFMVIIYRLLGVIASLSLILYIIFVLALVKLWPITLSLAGVAGLILSVGMAVDANVLIFERLKESLRKGSGLAAAIQKGFSDAWSSIVVSNVSSLLIALVLYVFGTSLVRGFAVMFALGVIVSMITAVSVTRLIIKLIFKGQGPMTRPWLLGVNKVEHEV